MMHSQSYNIFDKVNLYMIWRQEFALKSPKDAEVTKYFEISRTEAQRVKVVDGSRPIEAVWEQVWNLSCKIEPFPLGNKIAA